MGNGPQGAKHMSGIGVRYSKITMLYYHSKLFWLLNGMCSEIKICPSPLNIPIWELGSMHPLADELCAQDKLRAPKIPLAFACQEHARNFAHIPYTKIKQICSSVQSSMLISQSEVMFMLNALW